MKVRQAVRLRSRADFDRLKEKGNVIESHSPYNIIVFSNDEDQDHNPEKVASVTDASTSEIKTGLLKCYHKYSKRDEAIDWLCQHYVVAKKLPHMIAVEQKAENDIRDIMSSGLFILVEPDEIITVQENTNYTQDFYEPPFYWAKAAVPMCWAKLPEAYYGNVHVIDGHGMDVDHEDMVGQIAGAWDAVTSTTDITPVNPLNEKHMYPCAGIVAARTNNNIGVASIGGNRLKGYLHRVGWNPTSSGSFQMSGLALESALAKVLTDPMALTVTMSFGGGTKYPGVQIAIDNLRTLGRGGKGIPVLASSGNSGLTNFAQYPAAYTGVISVGAASAGGSRLSYSNHGPKLFCAAYTGIQSIDAEGDLGYKKSASDAPQIENYNTSFTGTSASSPFAAAQVAMLLAYKPELTELQVRQCIMESGERTGGYNYVDGKSLELGYGLVQMGRMFNWADGFAQPAPVHNFTCIISAPSEANPGATINIQVTARGNASAPASTVAVKLYWSANNTIDSSDPVVGTLSFNLGGGKSEESKALSYTIPALYNSRILIAKIDPDNVYTEPSETDNQYSVTVFIPEPPAPAGVDMAVISPYAYRATKMIGGKPTDSLFIEYQLKNTSLIPVNITSYAFAKGITNPLPAVSNRNVTIRPGAVTPRSTERIIGNPASPVVYCQIQKINGGAVSHEVIELTVGPAPL